MSNDVKKKGFLEQLSPFSLILIMVVLMVIGGALIPLLRVSYQPTPEQGKKVEYIIQLAGSITKGD